MKRIIPHILLLLILFITSCSSESNTVTGSGNENNGAVGDSANDLLSSSTYTKLIVEIAYVKDMQPTSQAISNFTSFLESRLNKPQGIQIIQKEITISNKTSYTINDVRSIENTHRNQFNNENEIAVFALFLDGAYSENTSNSSVLGVAHKNTSFVIFEETIQDLSSDPFSPSTSTIETTVINHEFGHILGLVNAGTPMQDNHQDTANGRHCTTESCLMYWRVETAQGALEMLSGGSIPNLDSFCLQDLKANGGK